MPTLGSPRPARGPRWVLAIVDSLAQASADAVDRVAALSGRTIETIHLVGGGVRNRLLCQVTADRSGREVIAGPVGPHAITTGRGGVLLRRPRTRASRGKG